MPRITDSKRKLNSQEIIHNQEYWSSDTLKITVKAIISFPTPSITGTPTGTRETQTLPSQRHGSFQLAPVPRANLELWLPIQSCSTLRKLYSQELLTQQNLRSLVTSGFQILRGSLTPMSSDTFRIIGSQNHRITKTARI